MRGGVLCHARAEGSAHAESLAADKTAMCGQVTAADITSHSRYEFSVFAGGRKYATKPKPNPKPNPNPKPKPNPTLSLSLTLTLTLTLTLALALALTLNRYAMRADTKFELDLWHEVCNRNGRMWLQARG